MFKLKNFIRILKMTETELLKNTVYKFNNENIINTNNFIYVKGDIPILLIAHLDTVHKSVPYTICKSENQNILMSPYGIGGDDRCGVQALYSIYDYLKSNKKPIPSFLFVTQEEKGGIGTSKFIEYINKHNIEISDGFMIEIDRQGEDDCVFYDCENNEFTEFIESYGFEEAIGSFTDISLLMPELKIAGVNISAGYFNQHTISEYINIQMLKNSITKVLNIIKDVTFSKLPIKFEFVEYTSFHEHDIYGDFNDHEYYSSLQKRYAKWNERFEIIESKDKSKNKNKEESEEEILNVNNLILVDEIGSLINNNFEPVDMLDINYYISIDNGFVYMENENNELRITNFSVISDYTGEIIDSSNINELIF